MFSIKLTGSQIIANNAAAMSIGTTTAAQWKLNAAMYANPVGLVVVALVGLVLILVALTKGMKDAKEGTDFICIISI